MRQKNAMRSFFVESINIDYSNKYYIHPKFGYSYGYAINLVQTMYAANSKIVHGTAQSGHLPYLLNAQAAQTLWEFVGLWIYERMYENKQNKS